MARQYGVITTSSGVTGVVVTGVKKGTSIEKAEARDGQGKVTDIKAYSKGKTISLSGLLDSASLSTEAGASITIDSVTYLVESAETNESNTAFADFSISASTADSATISAYSSNSSSNL